MLPPFRPFTARPLRRKPVKRVAAPEFVRDLSAADAPSIKGVRLTLKPDRLPTGGRLRILSQ